MSELQIRQMVLGAIRTNCYLAVNKETKEALIVDPADGAGTISGELNKGGLKPTAILLTHGHMDHIGAAGALRSHYGIPVYAGEAEEALLDSADANLSTMFGRPMTLKADKLVKDQDVLKLAGFEIRVFHTPGHTPGGCCYYFADQGVLFSGDTLFLESVGRTDFPGGSARELKNSVRKLLDTLPEETIVYPGHESETSVLHEKRYNPYA